MKARESYENKIQKLIVVNNLEKFLKYSINTFSDKENTNIILHSKNNKKDEEKFIYLRPQGI